MPRLSPAPIEVSEEQRQELRAIVRKRTNPQQLVTRARIILLANEQVGVHETARCLAVGRTTVQGWQRRWRDAEQGTVRDWLADAPRCGAPPTYTPEQICAIVAIACERPEDSARPITHWTQQEIAAEAMKRGIVDDVSQRSVGRFLKRSQSATPPHPRVVDRKAR